MLFFFGYATIKPNNSATDTKTPAALRPTDFFVYEEQEVPQRIKDLSYQFRKTNSEAISQVCAPKFDPTSFNYACNTGEIKDLFTEEDKKQIDTPGRSWAELQLKIKRDAKYHNKIDE